MRSFARVLGLAVFALVHDAGGDASIDHLSEHGGVTLSEADIRRVIEANRPAMKRCYEDVRAHRPELRVRLRVRVVIEPSGRVSSATDGGSELPHDGVRACVLGILQKAAFPRSDSPTNLMIPLNFVPPDPSADASIRDARAD